MVEAGMQCHSASYPTEAKSESTLPNQAPRSPARRAVTFSTSRNWGRSSLVIRQSSPHSPLRSACIPPIFPANERSWQGKPPVTTSTEIPSSANRSAVSSRTSSYCLTLGQCFASTRRQNGSISQKATVSKPPVLSRPNEKPPMPENKSSTLSFVIHAPHVWGSPLYPTGGVLWGVGLR